MNETTIPQAASDYLSRLVDSRKLALANEIVKCWQSGQSWPAEWPNLKAEYVEDVTRKLRRYGLKATESRKTEPEQANPVADAIDAAIAETSTPQRERKPRTPKPAPVPQNVVSLPASTTNTPGFKAAGQYLTARRVLVCLECSEAKSRRRKATQFQPYGAGPSEKEVLAAAQCDRCIKCSRVLPLGVFITSADMQEADRIRIELDSKPEPELAYAQAAG